MKTLRFVSVLLICSFQANLFSQKNWSNCNLIKKDLKIQECSIKSETLKKVLDEMVVKIEEESMFNMNIPYSKAIFLDKYFNGIKAELLINNGYMYLDSLDLNNMYFFNYKNVQILIMTIDAVMFNNFFEISKNSGKYITYHFVNERNSPCLYPLIIDQKIIYEIKGQRYRFQEKTLTHTELNW